MEKKLNWWILSILKKIIQKIIYFSFVEFYFPFSYFKKKIQQLIHFLPRFNVLLTFLCISLVHFVRCFFCPCYTILHLFLKKKVSILKHLFRKLVLSKNKVQ